MLHVLKTCAKVTRTPGGSRTHSGTDLKSDAFTSFATGVFVPKTGLEPARINISS